MKHNGRYMNRSKPLGCYDSYTVLAGRFYFSLFISDLIEIILPNNLVFIVMWGFPILSANLAISKFKLSISVLLFFLIS